MTQKPTITTVEQLRELKPAPCKQALAWLAENGITELADAWDRCHRADWMLLLGSVLGLLSDRERRLIACKCVRETPLIDGRTVWDLLTDERSRRAVAVAEMYAAGAATDDQLAEAAAAAFAAAEDAYAAAAADEARAAADAADAARAAAARADAMGAVTAAAAAAAYVARAAATTAVHAATVAAAYAADALDAARAAQADIVREIVGNPFRDSAA